MGLSNSYKDSTYSYEREFELLYLELKQKDPELQHYSQVLTASNAVADQLRGVAHVFVVGSSQQKIAECQYLGLTADNLYKKATQWTRKDSIKILDDYYLKGEGSIDWAFEEVKLSVLGNDLINRLELSAEQYVNHSLDVPYQEVFTKLISLTDCLQLMTKEPLTSLQQVKNLRRFMRVARYQLETIKRWVEVAEFVMRHDTMGSSHKRM